MKPCISARSSGPASKPASIRERFNILCIVRITKAACSPRFEADDNDLVSDLSLPAINVMGRLLEVDPVYRSLHTTPLVIDAIFVKARGPNCGSNPRLDAPIRCLVYADLFADDKLF